MHKTAARHRFGPDGGWAGRPCHAFACSYDGAGRSGSLHAAAQTRGTQQRPCLLDGQLQVAPPHPGAHRQLVQLQGADEGRADGTGGCEPCRVCCLTALGNPTVRQHVLLLVPTSGVPASPQLECTPAHLPGQLFNALCLLPCSGLSAQQARRGLRADAAGLAAQVRREARAGWLWVAGASRQQAGRWVVVAHHHIPTCDNPSGVPTSAAAPLFASRCTTHLLPLSQARILPSTNAASSGSVSHKPLGAAQAGGCTASPCGTAGAAATWATRRPFCCSTCCCCCCDRCAAAACCCRTVVAAAATWAPTAATTAAVSSARTTACRAAWGSLGRCTGALWARATTRALKLRAGRCVAGAAGALAVRAAAIMAAGLVAGAPARHWHRARGACCGDTTSMGLCSPFVGVHGAHNRQQPLGGRARALKVGQGHRSGQIVACSSPAARRHEVEA